MADPLSVAGSIAGLISLGEVLFRKLYHYVKDVKNAEKEVKELKNELALLNGVLHNVLLVAQDLEADSALTYSVRLDHVKSCLATLHKLNDALDKNGISEPRKKRKTMQKLVWPFKAINIREYLDAIHNHRDNLSFALAADSITSLLKSLSTQENIFKSIADIDARLRNQEELETRISLDKERQRILDYFVMVNPQPSFRTGVKLRSPTTGFWLKENEAYSKWMKGFHSHIWMSGIPGAGKTVLSGLVIQECMARATPGRAVAFYYCDYKNVKSQLAVSILSTIASQVARQNEANFQLLKDYYAKLHPQNQLKYTPEALELVELLRKMLSAFQDTRIIVDGLDECEDNVREVIESLLSLLSEDGNVYLALLSRDETDIREMLVSSLCGHLEIAAQSKDLDHYVRSEIEQRINTKRLRLKSTELKDEIVAQLVSRANGMFRWVSCQLDHLCELPTDALRRKALSQLPKTLHETYERLLIRVKEAAIPLVQTSLLWIAYAYPKLDVNQLVDIISLVDDELDPEARPDPEDVYKFCGSLVRRGDTCPELAHFTVLEFLRKIEPGDERLGRFSLGHKPNLMLATSCFKYLSVPAFNKAPPTTYSEFIAQRVHYPFHAYASRHVGDFLDDNSRDDHVLESMKRLFDPERKFNLTYSMLEYVSWHAAFAYHDFEHNKYEGLDEDGAFDEITQKVCSHQFGPLHAAAILNLSTVCEGLLEQGYDVNKLSPLGTPLECSIFGAECIFVFSRVSIGKYRFSERTVALLLGSGADCAAPTTRRISLACGAVLGPIGSFALLLRHGMLLDEESLIIMGAHWVEMWMEELLDKIGTLDTVAPEVQVHLLEIAKPRQLKAQLKTASNICITDAVFVGKVAFTVRFNLLETFNELSTDPRFTVDMREPEGGGTLLHLGMTHDAIDVVEGLLSLGYDPNKRNNGQQTIWHIAATTGSYNSVELLSRRLGLEHPALQAKCSKGRTPILETVANGHERSAMLFLDALGLTPPLLDDLGIFHHAIAQGLFDFIVRLAGLGFDVRTIDGKGRNALFYLTAKTGIRIMEFLLGHDLSVEHRDAGGKTPVQTLLSRETVSESFFDTQKGLDEVEGLEEQIFSKLATPEAVSNIDSVGNTSWYYFCTMTVPYVLGSRMENQAKYLIGLLSVLEQQGCCKLYQEITDLSGIALLAEKCLDTEVSQLGSPDTFRATETKDVVQNISSIFLYFFTITDKTTQITEDEQLTRLLVWATKNSRIELVNELIALGIEVNTPSKYFGGRTAIDHSAASEPEILDTLIKTADAPSLLKLGDDGLSLIHRLCSDPDPKERGKTVTKLEAILEKGADPNVISPSNCGKAAVHFAARHGFVEALHVLDRFHADFGLLSGGDWGVVQHALKSPKRSSTEIFRFLLTKIPEKHIWTRTFGMKIPKVGLIEVKHHKGCSALHLAARWQSVEVLELLRDIGYFEDIDVQTSEGFTPLHLAATAAHQPRIKWLLDNGADVNAASKPRKQTPLHLAMAANKEQNVLALIKGGGKFLRDSTGATPEMTVHPELRKKLLQTFSKNTTGIPQFVLDNLEKGRRSPSAKAFYDAIFSGNVKECRALIENGQSLSIPLLKCGSCTPLILALMQGTPDIIELLLENGASPAGAVCPKKRAKGPMFDSALNIAISNPKLTPFIDRILELCLSHEAHWLQLPIKCLHFAVAFNPDAIKILLKHVQKYEYLLSRHTALEHTAKGLLKALLDTGLEEAIDNDFFFAGDTVLHTACLYKRPEAVKILLSKGADVHATSALGRTPLHYAAISHCLNSAKMILEHGADIGSLDSSHWTPFMLMCRKGSLIDMESVLWNPEVDRHMTDLGGSTALHLAVGSARIEIFIKLINAGWNPYRKDVNGYSPIYYAIPHKRFATYIYAAGIDMMRLIEEGGRYFFDDSVPPRPQTMRLFYRRLQRTFRSLLTSRQRSSERHILVHFATNGDIDEVEVLLSAGVDMDRAAPNGLTPLNAACLSGNARSVEYLVRRGARLHTTRRGRSTNAILAAQGHRHILQWLLVGRHTDQFKIEQFAGNSSTEGELRYWSGTRQLQIPLNGQFQRQVGVSLLDHARYLHQRRDQWRSMVPLGWDPVAHFTPTIEEIRAMRKE